MSAATQTRIFGIRIGVDPKILLAGLIVLSGVLFWYNSRGDDEGGGTATTSVRPQTAAPAGAPATRVPSSRRTVQTTNGRNVLQVRPVDPTRGDVDPTLRLDLLARLERLQPATSVRNLFELGPAPAPTNAAAIKGPTIMPKPLPVAAGPGGPGNAAPAFNIPLKYYGFVRPMNKGESNQGFFLDGDNILVASEGQMLQQKYLVVALTPTSARLEDVQMKQGQTLPLVAEAAGQ